MRKQKTRFMKMGSVLLVLLAVMMLVFTGCQNGNKNENEKAITLEVVDNNGDLKSYEVKTDKEHLYDALAEVDGLTLDGYESEYGYYITAVNGLTADYDTDGAYWSLYVNDEYGMYGLTAQPVADGDVYKLAYEDAVIE